MTKVNFKLFQINSIRIWFRSSLVLVVYLIFPSIYLRYLFFTDPISLISYLIYFFIFISCGLSPISLVFPFLFSTLIFSLSPLVWFLLFSSLFISYAFLSSLFLFLLFSLFCNSSFVFCSCGLSSISLHMTKLTFHNHPLLINLLFN